MQKGAPKQPNADFGEKLQTELLEEARIEDIVPRQQPTFAHCLEGLQSCLAFSQDEAADPHVLLKLFEQATYVRPDLDALKLTTEVMQEFLKDIVELLSEQQEKLETVSPLQISQFCY